MKKFLTIAVLSLFLANGAGYAQSRDRDEDTKAIYKAAYLFSFTKLIDWPSSYKEGDFTIGILASRDVSNLYEELKKKYQGKRIGDQRISIKEYASPEQVDESCNILFIGEGSMKALRKLKGEERSTLLVSERSGGLQRGAVISFVIKNNQLEYIVSRSNAERYGLTMGNQLRELAYKVH